MHNHAKLLGLCLLTSLALMISSCGSDDSGRAKFVTVDASASSTKVIIDSDIAKWTGTECLATSTYVIKPDDVDFTITLEPGALSSGAAGVQASAIRINSYTVSFTPATTGVPAIPSFQQSVGQTVSVGNTIIPVRIMSLEIKKNFISNLVCQPGRPIWRYHVTVTFDGVEENTNDSQRFTGKLEMTISDFID